VPIRPRAAATSTARETLPMVHNSKWRWSPDGTTAVVAAALSAAVFLALVASYLPFTVDDAFITFRYADHLARGHGANWNLVGERAEGYTTALWMLVMAAPHGLGLGAEPAAKALGIAASLAFVALAAQIARRIVDAHAHAHVTANDEPSQHRGDGRLQPIVWLVPAVGLATYPATAIHAVSGMETALFTLLVTACLGVVATEDLSAPSTRTRRAFRWGVPVLFLLTGLTRPEGNLVAALAAFVLVARAPRGARASTAVPIAVGYVVPGLLYFLFRARYYGALLPLSFYVKAQHQGVLAGRDAVLAFLAEWTTERLYVFLPFVFALVSFPRVRAPALIAASFLAFFAFPAPIMAFDHRYVYPVLPFVLAVAGAGTGAACAWFFRALANAAARARARAVAVGSIAALLALGSLRGLDGSIKEKVDYGEGIRKAHIALARDLVAVEDAVRSRVVAGIDNGAIPYVSRWTAIDTFGLNDAHIARTGAHDPAYVLDQLPEVLVFLSAKADAFTPHIDWEQPMYDEAKRRGFVDVTTYEFTPDYHLWVMAAAESVVTTTLSRRQR
jgi:hypothetical protein